MQKKIILFFSGVAGFLLILAMHINDLFAQIVNEAAMETVTRPIAKRKVIIGIF
jgi:hypothetical protein